MTWPTDDGVERIEIGRWRVDADPRATARVHALLSEPDCRCGDCENFRAQREDAFPPDFRALLAAFGIDVGKPREVWTYDVEHGLQQVGGCFHFVGRLISGADAVTPTGRLSFERTPSGFEYGLTTDLWLPPEQFGTLPILQIDFSTSIPRLDPPPSDFGRAP